jgi:flagellar biosynthesis protein FlgN
MDDKPPLSTVLGEEIRCAEAMLGTLARENQALLAGNPDELTTATDAKSKLVDALEALECRRRAITATAASQGDDAQWQELRRLLADCKEQNQRNGALLKARADNLRIALKTLRGTEPDLYSATGRAPARSDARPLGTA